MLQLQKHTDDRTFTHSDGRTLNRIEHTLGTGNDALWWLERTGRTWGYCSDAAELEEAYQNSLTRETSEWNPL